MNKRQIQSVARSVLRKSGPSGSDGRCREVHVTEDAISIGGVDLADSRTYVEGIPYDAFRKLRERAPVAWHPYLDLSLIHI